MDDVAARLLRAIPAVGEFLGSAEGRGLAREFGEGVTKWELSHTLEGMRREIREGQMTREISPTELAGRVRSQLRRLVAVEGRRAINGTGILLHTGLGRSPMSESAIRAMEAAAGYTPLQANLESGDRSLREEKVERMLCELTGCQAATVVNNNAAATMLILNTLASGKEVIISRGQLIEIGGSFRMTDVMGQSGAILREVGTTNRTHLKDYEGAIGANTGAIIHVHTSNFRVRGFAGTPAIGELATLGRRHGLPVIDDLGSGALVPLTPYGLPDEPLVRQSLASGADVVCFSGDKLICGPQSGLICGNKAIIERIRKNPYARMFRVCKMTLAGLEATLLHFINGDYAARLPFYRLLGRKVGELVPVAEELAGALRKIAGVQAVVQDDLSYVGSGSIPDEGIATKVVAITCDGVAADELARRLRLGIPSVFGRLRDRVLLVDVRTLLDGEGAEVAKAVGAAVEEAGHADR